MVVFVMLMNMAFSWSEFHSGLLSSASLGQRSSSLGPGVDLIDLEAKPAESTSTAPTLLGSSSNVVAANAKAAFCPRDVLQDASHTFSRRYQRHVLIESAQEYELQQPATLDLLSGDTEEKPRGKTGVRTFKARTYLIGTSITHTMNQLAGQQAEQAGAEAVSEAAGAQCLEDLGRTAASAQDDAPCVIHAKASEGDHCSDRAQASLGCSKELGGLDVVRLGDSVFTPGPCSPRWIV